MRGSGAYRADPVSVGADLGEDGGLLGEIAFEPGAKADDAVNLPGTISVPAVQRTSRVPLNHRSVQIPHLTVTSCPHKALNVYIS